MKTEEYIEMAGDKKYPSRSSVQTLNRVMAYKCGLRHGIELMGEFAEWKEKQEFVCTQAKRS